MPLGPKKIIAGYTGKMALCACGLSHDKPFCDGRHRGTGKNPIKFMVEKDQEVLLCRCGYSANKPFCDGSHKSHGAVDEDGDEDADGLLPKKKGTSW